MRGVSWTCIITKD